ncbi:MAG: hypothetical protein JRE56_10820 [Deltaproteobacteria bacterium]|nr:hypothetical protein [Deltaproteobacteria bacterium]
MSRAVEAIVTIITALEGPDCHHSRSIGGTRCGAGRQPGMPVQNMDGTSRVTQG